MKPEEFKLGKRIKELRLSKKIKQKDLAIKLDMPISTLANYETDRRPVSIEILRKIADVLEISINDLLGASETFESDFDIESFDNEVKQYITDLKNKLKKDTSAKITNTLVLQNIIIDRIASEEVLKNMKMDAEKSVFHEFIMDAEKNLYTGDELKRILIDYYKQKYIKEKLVILEDNFGTVARYSGEALEKARKHYNDIPKYLIPQYILEKLYPEYLKQKEENRLKFEEMDKKQ